jgi:prepilin-type N-terminal cleavage/methylation domain-containing protein
MKFERETLAPRPSPVAPSSAFTLVELLIAVAIFAVVIVFFITMFLSITRVQVRQSSLAEVNGQSQFLLQELQYYIGQSSLIDMPSDTPTTTLKLRMPMAAQDPTLITLSSGTLYLQQANGALQPLSSSKVVISNLSFTKRSNAPAHDSVSISFTVAYNTSNIGQLWSEMLQTSIARVSAASFDSNVVPSSTATYSLGVAGQVWNSINGMIYFIGNNVGIGPSNSNPKQTLDVSGGVRINSQGSIPSCNSDARGMLWLVEQAPSANDSLRLCVENSSSVYQWVTIY